MALFSSLRDLLCRCRPAANSIVSARICSATTPSSGEELPFPDGIAQAVPDWRDLTRDPRKYGFHATLKAPMALAHGKTEAGLLAACKSFAATPRPIPVIRPVVNSISGFIAVVPAGAIGRTERLAADCVREFD